MSPSNSIPVVPLQMSARTKDLQTKFYSSYNRYPDFYVRVPGRVNLIGEHIDYCGYSVCPMALEQDVLLAVAAKDDDKLHLCNLDPNYCEYNCSMQDIVIDVNGGKPQWYQYFLCGVKGILDILPEDVSIKGFSVVVNGNIPPSAGLSSSSALVSAAALATSYVLNFSISKEKMANLCAACERYIGTQGGGMDQAIAFLATQGCAKLIDFSPLRWRDCPLPENAVFVVAHSLTQLNKAATADFNCRVVECRVAAQILAKKQHLDWSSIKKLGDLQQKLGFELSKMIDLVEQYLHPDPYSKKDIIKELETTPEYLNEVSLTPNTHSIETFKLYQRAMHVFREALRVQEFYSECTNSTDADLVMEKLGRLMSESHKSLRDHYECSHPQLDTLVELSKNLTLGARLTGAGWGGCTVALVPVSNVDKYIAFLKENFYKKHGVHEEASYFVFPTSPNSGACVYIAEEMEN